MIIVPEQFKQEVFTKEMEEGVIPAFVDLSKKIANDWSEGRAKMVECRTPDTKNPDGSIPIGLTAVFEELDEEGKPNGRRVELTYRVLED